MLIRRAQLSDADELWAILEPTIRAGETYTLPRTMSKEEALSYWTGGNREAFLFIENDHVLGTYYIRPNQTGGGDHIANCGYVTSPKARGRGIARQMCEHSLSYAKESGFKGMQFNFVVSTNETAIRLWQSLGFEIVGRLPLAFRHPSQGFVDALVMFRHL